MPLDHQCLQYIAKLSFLTWDCIQLDYDCEIIQSGTDFIPNPNLPGYSQLQKFDAR